MAWARRPCFGREKTLDTLLAFLAAAAAAYMSTNIDGFALLLDFFGDESYRAVEIAVGQLASVAIQLGVSIAITNIGHVAEAPFIGLAGIVPLVAGLRRIAGRRSGGVPQSAPAATLRPGAPQGSVGRLALVVTIATCGAVDNVLVYAGLLAGHGVADLVYASIIFAALTASLCLLAFAAARSRVSVPGLRAVAARIAPFMTTAIGAALLIRFGTFGWIYALA